MPNRRVHLAVATPVGVGYAAYKSLNQSGLSFLVESTGGAIGGALGGILPDIIDPPFSSWHRSRAHGLAPVSGAAAVWASQLDSWQTALRQQAESHHLSAAHSDNWILAVGHSAAELLFRLLAGFVAGFGAGYLSHVILDFGTPRCIPLIA